MRILALDFGTKRIGVAISDALLVTAQGMETLERRDLKNDLEKITGIIKDNGVSEVIVGLPLNMDGTYSQKTRQALGFAKDLSGATDVPVKTWDERLTTVQAQRTLLEADVSRAKRKKAADRLASQIILQSYLDFRKKRPMK